MVVPAHIVIPNKAFVMHGSIITSTTTDIKSLSPESHDCIDFWLSENHAKFPREKGFTILAVVEVVGPAVTPNTETHQVPFFINTALTFELDVMDM